MHGLEVEAPGQNVFIRGLTGTGRMTLVRRLLEELKPTCSVKTDRCYVQNFAQPDRPRLISVEAGKARAFRDASHAMMEELRSSIPALFETMPGGTAFTLLFFLTYLPISKHFHVVTSLPSVLFRRLDTGSLPKMDLEEAESFGVGGFKDLRWLATGEIPLGGFGIPVPWVILLLIAGIDTTWSAIGSSLWHLAQNPQDVQRLVDDPDAIPRGTGYAGLDDLGLKLAYYVMVDCAEFGVTDDNQFCRWMAKEVGVAAVPGSSFFHEPVNHLIRLHFSRNEEILAETGQRLRKLKSLVAGR